MHPPAVQFSINAKIAQFLSNVAPQPMPIGWSMTLIWSIHASRGHDPNWQPWRSLAGLNAKWMQTANRQRRKSLKAKRRQSHKAKRPPNLHCLQCLLMRWDRTHLLSRQLLTLKRLLSKQYALTARQTWIDAACLHSWNVPQTIMTRTIAGLSTMLIQPPYFCCRICFAKWGSACQESCSLLVKLLLSVSCWQCNGWQNSEAFL